MHPPSRPFNLWHLVWICTAIVVSFFGLWEFMEQRYFGDVDPGTLHWLYILRGGLGALILSTGAVWMVVRNRERAEADIRRSEEKYRSVMDDARDGIAIYRRGEGLIEVNPAFARQCGRTVASCLGLEPFAIVQLKDRNRLQEWLARCLEGEEPASPSVECRIVLPNGAARLWKITANRLQYDRAAASVLVNDITEESAYQQRLIQQEKLAGIGLLTAGVAHEIGNPLSSLSSVVQILQLETVDEGLKERLRLMDIHIRRIAKIVRHMADFARPPQLEWQTANVNEMLDRTLELLHYDRRFRDIEIQRAYAPHLPPVNVMVEGMEQVFMNLIVNAADAMDGRGRLTLSTAMTAQGIRVTVADTGAGMTPEEARRAFEPFFTTKPVGKGTGLGLAVSYGMVQRHGGTIEIESEKGVGTRIITTIPLRKDAQGYA
jgi:PAS domain S-box-containing protein